MADPITIMAGCRWSGLWKRWVPKLKARARPWRSSSTPRFARNANPPGESAQYDANIQLSVADADGGDVRGPWRVRCAGRSDQPSTSPEMSATNAKRDHNAILYKGELKALGYEDAEDPELYGAGPGYKKFKPDQPPPAARRDSQAQPRPSPSGRAAPAGAPAIQLSMTHATH